MEEIEARSNEEGGQTGMSVPPAMSNDKREVARNDKREKRNRLLAALFVKADKTGIEQEFLRDTIALNIIGKRLSKASSKEIFKVLEHLVKLNPPQSPFSKGGSEAGGFKRYEPSSKGLMEELTDVAKARWGEDFQKPLNAFINSHRKTPTHYKFLNVTSLKAFKERLKQLNIEY